MWMDMKHNPRSPSTKIRSYSSAQLSQLQNIFSMGTFDPGFFGVAMFFYIKLVI